MSSRTVEWIHYDDATGRVLAGRRVLPATRTWFEGHDLQVIGAEFALENGLFAWLWADPDDDTGRITMTLCGRHPDHIEPTWSTILPRPIVGAYHPGSTDLGFDNRTIPEGEVWLVNEHHRYGAINETMLAVNEPEDIFLALRQWSSLRVVDKRCEADTNGDGDCPNCHDAPYRCPKKLVDA